MILWYIISILGLSCCLLSPKWCEDSFNNTQVLHYNYSLPFLDFIIFCGFQLWASARSWRNIHWHWHVTRIFCHVEGWRLSPMRSMRIPTTWEHPRGFVNVVFMSMNRARWYNFSNGFVSYTPSRCIHELFFQSKSWSMSHAHSNFHLPQGQTLETGHARQVNRHQRDN
jgi:hypothetical protein